jgi:hypothetical protein
MKRVPAAPSTDLLTRVVAGFLVVILLDAAQLLTFYPARTDTLWAWKIQPEITAMVLASAYLGGCYFFARVLFGAPWERVALGLAPVTLFVWMAGIATILHDDRFIKDSLPFAAWVALYTVTPIGVPLLYLRGRRRWGALGGPAFPRAVRLGLGVVGGAIVVAGLVIAVAPDVAIDAWPWTLTPLTARIVAAVVGLYGSVWLSVAIVGSRAAAQIPLQAHALGLVALLVAVGRGEEAVDWGDPLAIALVVVTAAMVFVSAVLSWRAA